MSGLLAPHMGSNSPGAEQPPKREGRFHSNTLTFEPSFNPAAKSARNHRGRRRHILKVLFDARLIQAGSVLSMKYLDSSQGVRKKVTARVTPSGELDTDDGLRFTSASSFIMHYKKQPTHSHCIKLEGTNKSLTDLLKECEGKKGLLFSEYGVKMDMACGKRKNELSELASAAAAAGPGEVSDESGSEAAGSNSDEDQARSAAALSPEGSPAVSSARPEPRPPVTANTTAPVAQSGTILPTMASAEDLSPLRLLHELIARREIPMHLILQDFQTIHRQQLLRGAKEAPLLPPLEQLHSLGQPSKQLKFSPYSPTKKPRNSPPPTPPASAPPSPPRVPEPSDVHANLTTKLDMVNDKIDRLWWMVERVLPSIRSDPLQQPTHPELKQQN